MNKIDARCNHCGKINRISGSLAGELVVCKKCCWRFAVPFDAASFQDSPGIRSMTSTEDDSPPTPPMQAVVAVGAGVVVLLLILILIAWQSGTDSRSGEYSLSDEPEKNKSGYMGQTPDQAAREVTDKIISTPAGRVAVDRLASKDDQLTEFQQTNGISERIAEAAIKEWVVTHSGNFDWNLEDVKSICLRNLRNGIPYEYVPESEKRR